MQSDYYKLEMSQDCLLFEFESISDARRIKKIIAYAKSSFGSNIYNLGLGDVLSNGAISDLSISNNQDMPKIMATVIKSMLAFFNVHPDSSVYITGSTPSRTRLYNIIISKELSEARRIFEIYGLLGGEKELFIPNRSYDAFLITYLKPTER